MAKIKLEYIWLDGYYPTQNMRSKTKVEEHEDFQGTFSTVMIGIRIDARFPWVFS
jgi:glutamine synthetase